MIASKLNNYEIIWQEKVKEEFSEFCLPEPDEKWECLYKRLKETIFTQEKPLHAAATYGYEKLIEKILLSGENVNTRDRYGYTPLHLAAIVANQQALEILFKHGADPTLTIHGMTPLDMLVPNLKDAQLISLFPKETLSAQAFFGLMPNKLQTLNILLNAGFDINVKDSKQRDCLHEAFSLSSNRSALTLIKWLVEKGANVQTSDEKGVTPLHLACAKVDVFAADFLMAQGASMFITDKNGNTPFHYGLWKGDPEDLWDIECQNYKQEMQYFMLRVSMKMMIYSLKVFSLKSRTKNFIFSYLPGAKKEN